jgi:F420 biosynthesis protein FbiB-like protein
LNSFADFVRRRRSIRRYDPRPIPRDLLQQLCAAAIWSPSAHNRQPWRFVIITEKATQIHLAQKMGEKLRHDLAADGIAPDLIEKDARRSYQRLTEAAALILVCLTMEVMDPYPDPQRSAHERVMAIQSSAMAGYGLLLAAHAAGLGACWMCAPLFCPEVVQTVLALPSAWEAQGLITLGYPAETKHKDRQPLKEVILWR